MLSSIVRVLLGVAAFGVVSCAPKVVQPEVQDHSSGPSLHDQLHVIMVPASPKRNRRIAREIQSLIRRKVVKLDDVTRPMIICGYWPGLDEIRDDKGELVVVKAGKKRYLLKIEPFGLPCSGERFPLMRWDNGGFHDDPLFDGFAKGQVVVRRAVIWDYR